LEDGEYETEDFAEKFFDKTARVANSEFASRNEALGWFERT